MSGGMEYMRMLLPGALKRRLQGMADRRGVTLTELVRVFLRLGMLAVRVEESGGRSRLILEEDGQQRELRLTVEEES